MSRQTLQELQPYHFQFSRFLPEAEFDNVYFLRISIGFGHCLERLQKPTIPKRTIEQESVLWISCFYFEPRAWMYSDTASISSAVRRVANDCIMSLSPAFLSVFM